MRERIRRPATAKEMTEPTGGGTLADLNTRDKITLRIVVETNPILNMVRDAWPTPPASSTPIKPLTAVLAPLQSLHPFIQCPHITVSSSPALSTRLPSTALCGRGTADPLVTPRITPAQLLQRRKTPCSLPGVHLISRVQPTTWKPGCTRTGRVYQVSRGGTEGFVRSIVFGYFQLFSATM